MERLYRKNVLSVGLHGDHVGGVNYNFHALENGKWMLLEC